MQAKRHSPVGRRATAVVNKPELKTGRRVGAQRSAPSISPPKKQSPLSGRDAAVANKPKLRAAHRAAPQRAVPKISPAQLAALQSQIATPRGAATKDATASLASLLSQDGNGHVSVAFDLPQNGKPFPRAAKKRGARDLLVTKTDQIWANWGIVDDTDTVATGQLFTQKLFRPTTPAEIAQAIQQAEDEEETIRALGSGWSFSDAVLPQTTPTNINDFLQEITALLFGGIYPPLFESYGYAIDTSALTQNLQRLLPDIVQDGVDTSLLFFNEAGITLSALNVRLDNQSPPVAMSTLGGAAGQTLAGAISTGTHGSDFDRAPIADCVQALYIVGAGGKHHWVESKSSQFTDPQKIIATFPAITAANCHYDDNLFKAAMVSMGAMGVIYAAVFRVVPQYALIQFNLWSTWEQLQQVGVGGVELTRVAHGQLFPLLGQYLDPLYPPNDASGMPYSRALQVVVNPIKNHDGTHNCYATIRFELPMDLVPEWMTLPWGLVPGTMGSVTMSEMTNAILNSPDCGVAQQIAFWWGQQTGQIGGNTLIEQAQSLINFCKQYNYYWAIRAVIDEILQKVYPRYTVDGSPPNPQVDVGYKVMSGNVYGGVSFPLLGVTSIEPAFPFLNAIEFVNSALASFDLGIPNNIFPGGYVSLRACGPTSSFLGMQQFGELPANQRDTDEFPDVTGCVEISLLGNSDDYGVIEQVEVLALEQGGRLHWGQSNGMMNDLDVQERYPQLPKWQDAQKLFGGNTFVNLFMQRCGLA